MLNTVNLMGRFTKAPELRHTTSGVSVTAFTLAVDRDYAPKDGERETDFIECVAWRNTAEFVCKYFNKGSMAVVSGSLEVRKWTDKEGNNRRATEVKVENIYFGSSKQSQGGGETVKPVPAAPVYNNAAEDYADDIPYGDGDDLPF